MKKTVLIVVGLVVVLLAGVPLSAHHSGSTLFNEKTSVLKGVVKTWLWSNPHCLLTIEVTGADGQAVQWVFEMQSPNSIYPGGYRRTTFKEGDTVSVTLVVEGQDGKRENVEVKAAARAPNSASSGHRH